MRKEKASLPKQMLGIAKAKAQPLMLATAHECRGTEVGARLDLWEPCGHQSAVGNDPNFDTLQLFWGTAYFTPAEEGQLGSSWIELFARFCALGGKLEPRGKATSHRSFKKHLNFFMQTSRALFSTQGSSSTAEFFKPSRAQGARLRHYGIDCRIPCVQVVLCLNSDAATVMHNQLLTLKRPGRKAKNGSAIPTAFRLPQNCPWEPPQQSILAAALADKIERRLQNETACSEGTGHLSPIPFFCCNVHAPHAKN